MKEVNISFTKDELAIVEEALMYWNERGLDEDDFFDDENMKQTAKNVQRKVSSQVNQLFANLED
jgi:hypothetical protein